MMKYSERVSGSHCSSKVGCGGAGGFGAGEGVAVGVVESSGVGRTVAVAGVFGAGVLTAVVAGVFWGVPFPGRGNSGGAGAGRFMGRSGL
jgi:hypothetical protein